MQKGEEIVLEVKELTKQIDRTILVDHLNFSLERGDICGFLGENGVGKTTTLRMMTHLIFPTSGDVLIHGHSIRTDTQAALSLEGRRMLTSKSTLIYVIIYLTSYIILVIFFQLYGSDGSVLTEASAQSFPIQHLQAGTLFTGTFIAIYVAQITRQERTQGTIKLILLRPVSRVQYYISRILSIAFFSILLTLIQITVGYWYLCRDAVL